MTFFSKIENRGNESKGRHHTVSARLDMCSHPTFRGIPTAVQFQRQSLRLQIKQSIKVWEQVILCQLTVSQLLNFQKIHKLSSLVLVTWIWPSWKYFHAGQMLDFRAGKWFSSERILVVVYWYSWSRKICLRAINMMTGFSLIGVLLSLNFQSSWFSNRFPKAPLMTKATEGPMRKEGKKRISLVDPHSWSIVRLGFELLRVEFPFRIQLIKDPSVPKA